jgi:hypothetical protein
MIRPVVAFARVMLLAVYRQSGGRQFGGAVARPKTSRPVVRKFIRARPLAFD